ncbi:MAG: nitroreductase family protein [Chloroflexota bacterium]
MLENALYQAILARRSVRRYEKTPLADADLAQVREVVSTANPLVAENDFRVEFYQTSTDTDLVAALGGYGHIVKPPHYLAPYVSGEAFLLQDLGYRTGQMAVRLAGLGLGSCYIGSLGREAEVRARFGLPAQARIGALLVFGWPSEALGGRFLNSAIRMAAGATRKLPAERIFFQGSFDAPALPPAGLAPLIEAARHAPSAVNVQPWRFLWREGRLHLFVHRQNPRYGQGAGAEYRLFDGGICMANVALALEALGLPGRWEMVEEPDPEIPPHPPGLQPLARLTSFSL